MKSSFVIGLACVVVGFAGGVLYRSAFPRFRIYQRDYALGGNHMPIFLKFDNRTGQCWKSRGLDAQWHEMTYATIMSETNVPLDLRPAD